MKVFLVGYMGSGKSTVGKPLARELGVDFFDLDKFIRKTEGKSVEEIFEKEGETVFRGLERKALKRMMAENDNFVLATGGGTPCFYDNMKVMNDTGITVYLKMDVASLAYRLRHANEVRPLLADKNPEDLEAFVKQHLEERIEFYEDAQKIVPALGFDRKKIRTLAEELKNYVR
ncbi:shikimate kinase [Halocola ammonii]